MIRRKKWKKKKFVMTIVLAVATKAKNVLVAVKKEIAHVMKTVHVDVKTTKNVNVQNNRI